MRLRYTIGGSRANEIAASIEHGILRGDLPAGERLPPVRALASRLHVNPQTVASAYRSLRMRGVLISDGRRGTTVAVQPALAVRVASMLPGGVRNLAEGGPDPALLPDLEAVTSRLKPRGRMYGQPYNDAELLRLAERMFAADGIASGPIAIVGGALDGVERVLRAQLRVGDRVAVEDPGYHLVFDLLKALGLNAVPVPLDECGLLPEHLERVLRRGVEALLLTPRAQNPTGSALDRTRTAELRRVVKAFPDLLVIEDDHAGPVAGTPAFTVNEPGRTRWALVRSVSKWLGPDLRVAFLTGDELTIGRVEGWQRLGAGWVSNLLQQIVATLCSGEGTISQVADAAKAYQARREALIRELASHGIKAFGKSGLNVWIPVAEEVATVRSLLHAGWAVAGGERFRIASPPAVRVTISNLQVSEANRFAADFARRLTLRQTVYGA